MKKTRIFILATITGLAFIMSCTKEKEEEMKDTPEDSVTVRFTAFAGNDTLVYKEEFRDPLNRLWRVEKLIHYVSDVYLLDGNKEVKLSDVELITYERNGDPDVTDEMQEFKALVPRGTYDGIRMGIGLNPIQNSSDPGSYAPEHPLSGDQNMYWGQWAMYRFLVMDGRIDTDNDDVLDKTYSHHPGLDTSYVVKTFNQPIEVSGDSENILDFTFDFNEVYFGQDTVDAVEVPSWHGSVDNAYISVHLMSNLANSLELK